MAIFYTDVALNQQQNLNFPGQPGSQTLTNQPGNQNNPLLEGPPDIIATYTWVGTEVAGDIINIAILGAGWLVRDPGVSVQSGTTAPATTLTVAIGDNDLAVPTALPIPNPGLAGSQSPQPTFAVAPTWISATVYAKGNVVQDPGSTPANQVFTCIAATSASDTTQPHSDSTHWIANQVRYSASISIAAANGNVVAATGTQFYGGPASLLPYSVVPGQAALGLTANQIANQQYQIQQDCWAQAIILTASSIVAGTVSIFRLPIIASN